MHHPGTLIASLLLLALALIAHAFRCGDARDDTRSQQQPPTPVTACWSGKN